MSQMRKWSFVVATTTLMVMFQNCGRPMALSEQADTAVQSNISSLMVYSNVGSNLKVSAKPDDSASGSATHQQNVRYVVPIAIEFGVNPQDDSLRFRLDVKSGDIHELGSNRLIRTLEVDEQGILKVMFQDSAIANIQDLSADIMCAMVIKKAYASLVTDTGDYALGAGTSSCADDLFKLQSRQSAGMQKFLETLLRKMH